MTRILFKPEEVGEMLGGLTRSTIMSLRLSERWPYTKIGGSIMFSQADIDEIISRGSKTPEPKRSTRTRRTR